MKTKNIMIALTLLTTGTTWAEDFPKDSLKVVDIEEVVVIATPKQLYCHRKTCRLTK